MKSKLKSIVMALAAAVFMFTACQETEVFDDANSTGTAASPTKPSVTIGQGTTARTLITADRTLFSDTTYFLNGEVVVESPATLTIQAGTLIRGVKDTTPSDADTLNSVLVIDTGAKIIANGTPSNPIVFTSDQPAGSRNPGDWGGVVILGTDVVNQPGTVEIEGLSDPLEFGGGGEPDGSGSLTYARIEFSGTILQDGNETNGLTLGGVSSATTLNHIQVSRGNDDGFEWFGGTVNAEYIVSWQSRDDDFDSDFGHTGYVQYAISRRSNTFVSTESNGIETDNDGSGSNASPETNTLFANVTFIGPGSLTGDGSEIDLTAPGRFNAGTLIRRNSATNLLNSIITSWPTANNLRDTPTAQNYVTTNTLKLEGISVGLPAATGSLEIRTDNLSGGANNAVINLYGSTNSANTVDQVVFGVTNPASIVGLSNAAFATGGAAGNGNPGGTPDFTLVSGSANLTNAVNLSAADLARGLTQTNFRGAFDMTTGGWNFNSGWLEFDPENAVYH